MLTILSFKLLGLYLIFYDDLPLILAWISNNIDDIVWDKITQQFPNPNGAAVEVWEWISNFIPYCTVHVFIYPYLDSS